MADLSLSHPPSADNILDRGERREINIILLTPLEPVGIAINYLQRNLPGKLIVHLPEQKLVRAVEGLEVAGLPDLVQDPGPGLPRQAGQVGRGTLEASLVLPLVILPRDLQR